jgi:hypothetical protein
MAVPLLIEFFVAPRHHKLITALRTAVENRRTEGVLDKGATLHDDLFDAF